MQNRAAWLTEKKAYPFKVDDAPTPTPSKGEVLIANRATAINPVDWYIQTFGFIYEDFPVIIGEDSAGEVAAVGPDVTSVKVGDRVLGVSTSAFQLFCLAHEAVVTKLPENVSYAEAAVLPLCMMTAAHSLFAEECLALPYPQLQPKETGKTLFIWGGSTTVGSCAIQMARAAGLRVITTCSPRNFDYCKELGAEVVFDYNSPSIVEDAVNALKDEEIPGVLVAINENDAVLKTAQITSQLRGRRLLATVAAVDMQVPKGLPENVETCLCLSPRIKENGVGAAVFGKWLSPALASGQMKCKPDPKVIGRGLEKIQDACDTLKAGVSASKIAVELP